MPTLFNELLQEVGIDPAEVRLLRHHTRPGLTGQTLFDLWRDDREGFELYQSTQRANVRKFRTGRYWASFVSPAPGTTLFVGLYEIRYRDTRVVDWPCPYRGDLPGQGQPVDLFDYELRAELSELIGKLFIEWDPLAVRQWARYARNAQFEIVGRRPRLKRRMARAAPRSVQFTRGRHYSRGEVADILGLAQKQRVRHPDFY